MVVIGGITVDEKKINEMICFDFLNMTWKNLNRHANLISNFQVPFKKGIAYHKMCAAFSNLEIEKV
jgi:hypothetical protein